MQFHSLGLLDVNGLPIPNVLRLQSNRVSSPTPPEASRSSATLQLSPALSRIAPWVLGITVASLTALCNSAPRWSSAPYREIPPCSTLSARPPEPFRFPPQHSVEPDHAHVQTGCCSAQAVGSARTLVQDGLTARSWRISRGLDQPRPRALQAQSAAASLCAEAGMPNAMVKRRLWWRRSRGCSGSRRLNDPRQQRSVLPCHASCPRLPKQGE